MSAMLTETAAVSRAQRLWAVLLVLDSFFVIIFGGALAAKLYQHWHAPPSPLRRAARVPKGAPKPAPAAPPAAASTPEPAKNEAKAPEPQAAAAAANKPLAKPSLLQEPPKRREAPALKNGGGDTPAAATAKAVPTEFKIKAPGAKTVELAGAFLVRTGGVKPMVRRDGDLWTLRLYLTPNTYRYHFLVDGKKTLDPENPATEKGSSIRHVLPKSAP